MKKRLQTVYIPIFRNSFPYPCRINQTYSKAPYPVAHIATVTSENTEATMVSLKAQFPECALVSKGQFMPIKFAEHDFNKIKKYSYYYEIENQARRR